MKQLKEYRDLLKIPGARSLLLLSLLTRGINIPIGAIITVISYELSGSWSEAALAGGLTALASALVMWLSGKWMDIWSPRKILLLFLPGGLVPLLFLFSPEGATLFLVALAIGFTRPPSGTTIRISWQRIIKQDRERLLAYGLDASTVPLAGALGALLAALIVSLAGETGLVLFLSFMSFLSTLLLALHRTTAAKGLRPSFSWHQFFSRKTKKKKKEESLPPLGSSVYLTVVLVALSWSALVGLEILVGDHFGSEMLLAVTALGGLAVATGAILNNRARDRSGKSSLVFSSLLAAISLVIITLAFLLDPLLAFPAVISFGLARGIISASGSTYLSVTSPVERRSEALGLYASGVLVGQAFYRPLSGVLLLFAPALILLLPGGLFALLAFFLQKTKNQI